MDCTKLTLCLITLFLHGMAVAACEQVPLSQPEAGHTIGSTTPTLIWRTAQPERVTRVQILSYTPEGGVIRTIDVATEQSSFTPSQALTPAASAVKVLLTQGCGSVDHEDLLAQPVSFFIDTALTCEAPSRGEVLRRDGSVTVLWAASTNALHYETRILEPYSEKHRSAILEAPRVTLNPPSSGGLLKGRSLCGGGRSDWLRLPLD
jgi:hypothetical protein